MFFLKRDIDFFIYYYYYYFFFFLGGGGGAPIALSRLCACTGSSGSSLVIFSLIYYANVLTLKAPITTAADAKFCDIFPSFRKK